MKRGSGASGVPEEMVRVARPLCSVRFSVARETNPACAVRRSCRWMGRLCCGGGDGDADWIARLVECVVGCDAQNAIRLADGLDGSSSAAVGSVGGQQQFRLVWTIFILCFHDGVKRSGCALHQVFVEWQAVDPRDAVAVGDDVGQFDGMRGPLVERFGRV